MKSVMMISLFMLLVGAPAFSQSSEMDSAPLTKIEEILTTNGTFIEKDFYDIGKIGCKDSEDLILKALVLYEPQNDEKTFGLALRIFSLEKFKSILSYAAYIDYHDLAPLIQAFEIMNVKADSLINDDLEYKEIIYKVSNGIAFGFYQEKKRGKPSQTGFCSFNDWDSDAIVHFGINRFTELIQALKKAETLLQDKGA